MQIKFDVMWLISQSDKKMTTSKKTAQSCPLHKYIQKLREL